MNNKLLFNSGGIDISDNNNLLEIGTKIQEKTIKIGNENDNIKIMNNKMILDINKDIEILVGQNNNDIGLIIKNNNNELGYIKTSNDYKSYNIKAPKSNNIINIKDHITEPFDLVYKLYNDIQNTSNLSTITSIIDQQMLINNLITEINNNKLNNYKSDNSNITLGDGTYSKLNNSMINNNSISIEKLIKSNNQNEILCGDGLFRSLNNINDLTTILNNLRLNTILTDNNLDINNHRISNISNAIDNKDAINLQQLNDKITNLNNILSNNSLDIDKIKFNGDGSQVLCSDGQWRSQPLQTLLFNGNNTYEYTQIINDINDIYNNLSTIQNQFYLIYTIRILNTTKKIKTSCRNKNNKIIQSGLTSNNQILYIDETIVTDIDVNILYNQKTNTSYDGSVYLTSNSNNYLNNNNNIRISIMNGVISNINNNPYGYKLSINNNKYYCIPFILTNINFFFNKTNYYMSNDNNIYNWDNIALNYLLQFNFDLSDSKIFTSNDSVNNFIIYIIGSNNYLDCKINLVNNTITCILNNIIDYFSNNYLDDQILSYEQNFNIDGKICYNKLNKYYYDENNYIDLITNKSKMYVIDGITNILYLIDINNNKIIYNKTNIYKL